MNPDYSQYTFVPEVEITKRADNGHYVATANGLSVTHWDQAEAINRLNEKLHNALLQGELTPGQS